MKGKRGLFSNGSTDAALHPNYLMLRDSLYHGAARDLMDSLYERMGDSDGNFVKDFQTHGFHSRVFELGCFAYFDSLGFSIDRTHRQPDFLASKDGFTVALEATAANPTEGKSKDIAVSGMKGWSKDETAANVEKEFPRRMLSVLTKKLEKRYDRLEHCQGKPLVFAVAPFFEPGSVFHVDIALAPCLFGGMQPSDLWGPSPPIFSVTGSEALSAVLFCNQFTVSRFLRMAPSGSFKRGAGTRSGFAYMPGANGRSALVEYRYDLADDTGPGEEWAQGVTLFHNPNATTKLPHGALPCTSEFKVSGRTLIREVHAFHPLTMTTKMIG